MGIKFDFLSSVFTRRHESQSDSLKPLTPEFRYRVRQLCADEIPRVPVGYRDDTEPFWLEMFRTLNFLEGKTISNYEYRVNDLRAVDSYLQSCDDGKFLDFIELVFQAKSVVQNDNMWNSVDRKKLIISINQFLQADDLPYSVT